MSDQQSQALSGISITICRLHLLPDWYDGEYYLYEDLYNYWSQIVGRHPNDKRP